MVTGECAFPQGVSAGHFVAPTDRRPELPRSLDAFLERALAEDPAARFSSAEGMREALLLAVAPTAPAGAQAVADVVDACLPPTVGRRSSEVPVLTDDRVAQDAEGEPSPPADDLPPTVLG